MSNIVYKEESFDAAIDDMRPLFEAHWEEVALNKDKVALNPDYDKYREIANLGMIRIFTAREDGELVGYFVVTIAPHLHYKDHKYALNDVIYLTPDLRAMGIGKGLISFAESVLQEAGISVLIINMKVQHPFDPLLEKLGFTSTERVYSKYIGE